MTPAERAAREAELVRDHGLTPAEAELAVAMEAGESDGDIEIVAEPDDPIR